MKIVTIKGLKKRLRGGRMQLCHKDGSLAQHIQGTKTYYSVQLISFEVKRVIRKKQFMQL